MSAIENCAIIGNCHTAALIDKSSGSIDMMCYPRFDSPSVFARLVSPSFGGHFSIAPVNSTSKDHCCSTKQMYLHSSNVLRTQFAQEKSDRCLGFISQITDWFPVSEALQRETSKIPAPKENITPWTDTCTLPWLMRKVDVVRGVTTFRLECYPAFDYARSNHMTRLINNQTIAFHSNDMSTDLRCIDIGSCTNGIEWNIDLKSFPLRPGVFATFTIQEGESLIFIWRWIPHDLYGELPNSYKDKTFLRAFRNPPLTTDFAMQLLDDSRAYWHQWISHCTYRGRWREIVHRAALVLKLLTYSPTGAIVAAVTFGLPEVMGGNLNWDYRYVWIRDAAFVVYAMLRIGLRGESSAFMRWVVQRYKELQHNESNRLRVLYDVFGRPLKLGPENASEVLLCHLEGYRNSRPVRIGNAAADQYQLDIYGELMDAIYLHDKYVAPISFDAWCIVRENIINVICKQWEEPDHGLWELREEPRQHVFTKVMNWVAIDRGLRLANKRSLPAPDRDQWIRIRDSIHEQVMQRGWNAEGRHFVQVYDGISLDAANLMMPLVFFLSPSDPRLVSTLEATLRSPEKGGLVVNNLCFRFRPNSNVSSETDQPHTHQMEGTFCICTFWLVEALARAGRYRPALLHRAVDLFEDMLGYANHCGLYSEEIDANGTPLGNYPQAFTHLSLISAAFHLDRVLNEVNE